MMGIEHGGNIAQERPPALGYADIRAIHLNKPVMRERPQRAQFCRKTSLAPFMGKSCNRPAIKHTPISHMIRSIMAPRARSCAERATPRTTGRRERQP